MPLGRKAASMLRALDKLLVKGLGSLKQSVARDLAGFLRANGLGKAADRARDLRDERPDRRYRAFVELRIALEESVVKLFRPPGLPAPTPGRHLTLPAGSAPGSPAELVAAARRFDATPGALVYLAQEPDLGGLTPPEVEVLLANDDLREGAAERLRAAPQEVVRGWVEHLVRAGNGLARRGAYLLVPALDPAVAAAATMPSWSRPEDHGAAREAFFAWRGELRPGLLPALEADAEVALPARRFALRMLARSAQKGDVERWEPAVPAEDAELQALLQIARFKAGEVTQDRLRSWAAQFDEPELRALAILQCWLEGDPPRGFQQELQREEAPLDLLLDPLRGTSRLEPMLRSWVAALDLARPPETRHVAVDRILAAGDRRVAEELLPSLRDPDERLPGRLLPFLTECLGLLPVRLSVDLGPLLRGTELEALTSDQVRAFQRHLLPAIPAVPDLRFAPFLGALLGRDGPQALAPEAVEAMGAALLGELAGLLTHPEKELQLLAFRSLEALRQDPRAAKILADHEAGQDPLEAAVEKLLVEKLRPEGRAALEELEPAEAIPRLLELARTRKKAREPILEVLTAWRAEAALPFLFKLLGSPLPDMVRGKPGSRETRWLQKPAHDHLQAFGEAARAGLEDALGSENWTVRHHAAHLLGRLGDPRSASPLARALEEEDVEETRNQLVQALGGAGGPDAVVALEPLVRSSVLADQLRAVRALAGVAEPAVDGLLAEVLAEASDLGLKREIQKAQAGRASS